MIKDDDRIEFIFEKVITEPSDEDSGTSVELFVRYEQDGPFGPTVGFTEELEPSKRAKAEWTYLPISFIKEIAEYLHSKGAIEKLEGAKSSGSSSNLPNPVVAKPKPTGNSLNLPQMNSGRPSPVSYNRTLNPNNMGRPTPPTQGPRVVVGQNDVEIQNSTPPYQQPLNDMQMRSQPQPQYQLPNESYGYGEIPQPQPNQNPQDINPFGGEVASSNYQAPIQSFASAMMPQPQPQQPNQPQEQHPQQQYPQQPQGQSPQQQNPQSPYQQYQNPQGNWNAPQQQANPNDLTSMLNSDVQETPAHLKGQAAQMLQQRAQALNKQINGVESQKIKPQGQTRVDPSTLVPRENQE